MEKGFDLNFIKAVSYQFSNQVSKLIPPSVAKKRTPQEWVEGVHKSYQKHAFCLSSIAAKRHYIGTVIIFLKCYNTVHTRLCYQAPAVWIKVLPSRSKTLLLVFFNVSTVSLIFSSQQHILQWIEGVF